MKSGPWSPQADRKGVASGGDTVRWRAQKAAGFHNGHSLYNYSFCSPSKLFAIFCMYVIFHNFEKALKSLRKQKTLHKCHQI